jgi:serine/threonine protein phosphatase 1
MNIWAVGDIHGRSDLLRLILKKLNGSGLDLSKDKLIFLGDYIDRGPDSKGVLEIVMDLDKNPNVVCLLGNHDDFLLDAVSNGTTSLWCNPCNGGDTTLESFGGHGYVKSGGWGTTSPPTLDVIPKDIVKWYKTLPLAHWEPGFFFSHAPLPRDRFRPTRLQGMGTFERKEYLWTRPRGSDEFGVCRRIEPTDDGGTGTIGVCGHNKIDYEPRLFDHYYCIDTICGCHPKGRLTAIECRSKTIIQAFPKEVPGYKESVRKYEQDVKEWRKRLSQWMF